MSEENKCSNYFECYKIINSKFTQVIDNHFNSDNLTTSDQKGEHNGDRL